LSRDLADRCTLLQSDIRTLPSKLHSRSIDAIVTELDLGPPIRGTLTPQRIEAIRRTLLPLYRDAFAAFANILKPGGPSYAKASEGKRLVVALPAWRVGSHTHFVADRLADIVPSSYSLFSMPYTLPQRGTFIYGRPDQHVWREIVVAEK
jgi:tRNA G10  N-methylase Trm11